MEHDYLTTIYKISDDGTHTIAGYYVNKLSSKENLISFIQQEFHNNYNTWAYPKNVPGITKTKFGGEYFIDIDDSTYITRRKPYTINDSIAIYGA